MEMLAGGETSPPGKYARSLAMDQPAPEANQQQVCRSFLNHPPHSRFFDPMRRLNIKLSVSLVVGLLVMVAGVHVIHGIQIDKNAVVLLKEAERAEQEGEPGMRRAVKKYGQYLKHRPEDVVAQEKFALLAADLANMPGSSQEEMRLAYRAGCRGQASRTGRSAAPHH